MASPNAPIMVGMDVGANVHANTGTTSTIHRLTPERPSSRARREPSSAVTIPIEKLVARADWDAVGQRVKRLKSLKRIGLILQQCLMVDTKNQTSNGDGDGDNVLVPPPHELLSQLFSHVKKIRDADGRKKEEKEAEAERARKRAAAQSKMAMASNADGDHNNSNETSRTMETQHSGARSGGAFRNFNVGYGSDEDEDEWLQVENESNDDTSGDEERFISMDLGRYHHSRGGRDASNEESEDTRTFEMRVEQDVLGFDRANHYANGFSWGSFCNIASVETIAFVLGELKDKFDMCASHEDLEYGMAEVWKKYVKVANERVDVEFERGVRSTLSCIGNVRKALHQVKTLEDLQQTENAEVAAIYHKIEFLLQQGAEERAKWQRARARHNVDNNGNTDSSYSNAVIISNMIQRGYPLFIIWFWLKMHPEEASHKDKDGKLPLHYAVHYEGTHRRYNQHSNIWDKLHCHSKTILLNNDNANNKINRDEDSSTNSICCVKFVLERYPDAASVPDPTTGNLPLTVILQKGQEYERANSLLEERAKERIQLDQVVPLLHAAAKTASAGRGDALSTRDPKSKLYPFMMVRSATMDLAYTLLRENPAVLQPFIVQTDYERHLKRKMSCLEDKVKDLERQLALSSKADNTIQAEKTNIQIQTPMRRKSKQKQPRRSERHT
jgi:hypothetical protein